MSKAGCPYDNAVMERYFNTLKSELLNQTSFSDLLVVKKAIENFAYNWYNIIRPHTYNCGLPPLKVKRSA